ncbi:MAG: DUF1189 domain-containing protein, partial [Gammaproteobacteria bacterium]|nr:DUF1189 domain-containing protein [Gammaproteobacteria bacterium]
SKHSVKYETAYRLTLVAVTPAIILGTLLSIFRIHYPYQLLFYFVLSMGYLFFAITAAKQ